MTAQNGNGNGSEDAVVADKANNYSTAKGEPLAPVLPMETKDPGTSGDLNARPLLQKEVAKRRKRIERSFPAVPFEQALELPRAIQSLASGKRVMRLTLFQQLNKSPDSGTSRQLITNSGRYGLTTGSYTAEYLELTEDGRIATSDEVGKREQIRSWFKLAIEQIQPFAKLYNEYKGSRLPVKSIMTDFLKTNGLHPDELSECVDTFLLNAKFVGVLQNVAGAERLMPIDHVLDQAPATNPNIQTNHSVGASSPSNIRNSSARTLGADASNGSSKSSYDDVCFVISPIGQDGSEQRQHADLFLGSIIEPALEEFGLSVVRADQIGKAGLINDQIIEHIMRARLVIADLSYHNPNVFYELALRHASRLPTVQIMRSTDHIPFDVSQVRTILIDTSSIYTLVPQLEVYKAAIASQVRQALEDPDAVSNPLSAYFNASAAEAGQPSSAK